MTPFTLSTRINALLPQTQCTRCGYPTCRAYADAIAQDRADINQCPPGGVDGVAALAHLLGRATKALNPANGLEDAPTVAAIDEDTCIGCTKCIAACPTDAIVGAAKHMHTIIADECTGCGLCLPPCPVDCIALLPVAPRPLARTQVLARAAHARERFDARTARLARTRAQAPRAKAISKQAVAGNHLEGIAAETAPVVGRAPPISRAAVLDAIARGKARRAGAKEPQAR